MTRHPPVAEQPYDRDATSSARDQLHWLFETLDDEQVTRALAVLEAHAEWVLTGSTAPLARHRAPAGQ